MRARESPKEPENSGSAGARGGTGAAGLTDERRDSKEDDTTRFIRKEAFKDKDGTGNGGEHQIAA